MYLLRLELEEFRLYHRLLLDFPERGLRVSGGNAAGKSTLVEAVAMLATLRSPRAGSDREVINWESGKDYGVPPYARVLGRIHRVDGDADIELGLQVDPSGEGPLRKSVKSNGRAVRALDAVGELKVVLFSPEDVTLVSGPPSGRRRYLDLLISQIDRRYVRSLSRFNRVLEQRNSLLKSLAREGRAANSATVSTQLAFWDDELVVYGSYIVARRLMICSGMASLVRQRFGEFSEGGDLSLTYRPSVAVQLGSGALDRLDADEVRSLVHRAFQEQLEQVRGDELRRGVSLAGPQRDDFVVALNGVDIGTYGSRGQQRLAVVALKLAEADQMSKEAGEAPVILLDDVLSELDAGHRDRLLAAVSQQGAQLILTSTDRRLLEHESLGGLPLVRVRSGSIEEE